jgi:hypothetical protein
MAKEKVADLFVDVLVEAGVHKPGRGARLISGFAPTDFNFNRELSGLHGASEVNLKPVSPYPGR